MKEAIKIKRRLAEILEAGDPQAMREGIDWLCAAVECVTDFAAAAFREPASQGPGRTKCTLAHDLLNEIAHGADLEVKARRAMANAEESVPA